MTGDSPRAMSRTSTPYGIERPIGSSFAYTKRAAVSLSITGATSARWSAASNRRPPASRAPRAARYPRVIAPNDNVMVSRLELSPSSTV